MGYLCISHFPIWLGLHIITWFHKNFIPKFSTSFKKVVWFVMCILYLYNKLGRRVILTILILPFNRHALHFYYLRSYSILSYLNLSWYKFITPFVKLIARYFNFGYQFKWNWLLDMFLFWFIFVYKNITNIPVLTLKLTILLYWFIVSRNFCVFRVFYIYYNLICK